MKQNNYARECGWRSSIPVADRKIPDYDSKLDTYCGVIRTREYKKKLQRVRRRRNKIADALSNALFRASKHDDVSFVSPFRKAPPLKKQHANQSTISHSLSRPTSSLDSVGAQYRVNHTNEASSEVKIQELQTLKKILIREGYIRRLKKTSKTLLKMAGAPPKDRDNDPKALIVDLLVDVREASLNVVDSIISWRYAHLMGFNTNESELRKAVERPFIWNGMNYLVKMSTDMNFLANVHPLVEALGVPPTILIRNPFAYPRNLDSCPPPPNNWKPIPPSSFLRQSEDPEELKNNNDQRIQNAEQTIIAETMRVRDEVNLHVKGKKNRGKNKRGRHKRKRTGKREMTHSKSMPEHTGIPGGDSVFGQIRPPIILEKGWLREAKKQMRELETDLWKSAWPHNSATGRGKQKLEPLKNNYLPTNSVDERAVESSFATSFPQVIHTYSPKLPKHYIFNRSMESLRSDKRKPLRRHQFPEGSLISTKSFTSPSKHVSQKVSKDKDTSLWTKDIKLLSASDIEDLAAVDHPSPLIRVVAASIMVLLSPGNSLPADLSWNTVRNEFINSEAFLHILRSFDGSSIPEFKIRALHPFITQKGFDPQILANQKSKSSQIAAVMCSIVLKIIRSRPEYLEWLGAKDMESLLKGMSGNTGSIETTEDAEENFDYSFHDEDQSDENQSDYSDEFEDAANAYEDDFENVVDNHSKQLLENAFGDGNTNEINDNYNDDTFEKESRPNTQRQKSRHGVQAGDEFPAMAEDGEFGDHPKKIEEKADEALEESFSGDPTQDMSTNIILTAQKNYAGKECFVSMFFGSGPKGDRIVIKIYDVQSSMELRRNVYQDDVENLLKDGPHQKFLTLNGSGSLQRMCAVIMKMIYLDPETGIEFDKNFYEKEASVKIQCMVRQRGARKRMHEKRMRKEAPIKIQSSWRQRQAKKSVAKMRERNEGALKMQNLIRRKKSQKRVTSMRRAKSFSQRSQRADMGQVLAHHGLKINDEPYLLAFHKHRSVVDLSKGIFVVLTASNTERRFYSHISFDELLHLMRTGKAPITSLMKSGESSWSTFLKDVRKHMQFVTDNAGYVHISLKGYAHAHYLDKIDQATDAATAIQKHVRGRVSRTYHSPKRNKAATKIQSRVRIVSSRKKVKQKKHRNKMARRIQGLHRQRSARDVLHKKRTERKMLKDEVKGKFESVTKGKFRNSFIWDIPINGTKFSVAADVVIQTFQTASKVGLVLQAQSISEGNSKKHYNNTIKFLNAIGLSDPSSSLTCFEFLHRLQDRNLQARHPAKELAFHFKKIYKPHYFQEVFKLISDPETHCLNLDCFETYFAAMSMVVSKKFKCVILKAELVSLVRSHDVSITKIEKLFGKANLKRQNRVDENFEQTYSQKIDRNVAITILETLELRDDIFGQYELHSNPFAGVQTMQKKEESIETWYEHNEFHKRQKAATTLQRIQRGRRAKEVVGNMRRVKEQLANRHSEKFAEVYDWLSSLPEDMSIYTETFLVHGFDTVGTFGAYITKEKLSAIGITQFHHQTIILDKCRAMQKHVVSSEKQVLVVSPVMKKLQARSFYHTTTDVSEIRCSIALVHEHRDAYTSEEVVKVFAEDEQLRMYELHLSVEHLQGLATPTHAGDTSQRSLKVYSISGSIKEFCNDKFGPIIATNLALESDIKDRRKKILVIKKYDQDVTYGKKKSTNTTFKKKPANKTFKKKKKVLSDFGEGKTDVATKTFKKKKKVLSDFEEEKRDVVCFTSSKKLDQVWLEKNVSSRRRAYIVNKNSSPH
eukprot:g3478.t1